MIKLNKFEKGVILAVAMAAVSTCVAKAGLGETYAQSCRQYGSRGTWHGDNCTWIYRNAQIVEGFDTSGRCAIIQISTNDLRYPLPLKYAQSVLVNLIPAGYFWQHYGNNSSGYPCWRTVVEGVRWYAMYYQIPTASTATGPTTTTALRVSTQEQLVGRGYTNPDGSEPNSMAVDVTSAN
jgi:hypothetical protein